MRLLHTADWHLGARLGRHDRLPDQRIALRGLLEVAESAQPDLVVHAGDLFDASRPPYDALRTGVRALTRLARTAPTVVLAGNHDSPALFAALHDLVDGPERRLWFVSQPGVLTIPGVDDLALTCMPYLPPTGVVDLATTEAQRFEGSYADAVRALTGSLLDEAAARVGRRGIVVHTAHLHVHGARPGRSERRITVGEDVATHVDGLDRAMYAAFGHIHDPQLLPGGTVTGRYAGSLIPIDFGEATQDKRVLVVDLGDDVVIDEHLLPTGRRLVDVHGSVEDLDARAADGALDDALLRGRITSDDPVLDLADRVVAASPGCAIFDLVNVVRDRAVAAVDEREDPRAEPPLPDLLREWRASAATAAARTAPTDAVVELFDTALQTTTRGSELGVADVLAEATSALEGLRARPGAG